MTRTQAIRWSVLGSIGFLATAGAVVLLGTQPTEALAQPKTATPTIDQFGGTAARNMVNLQATGIPTEIKPDDDKILKWKVDLGSRAYGGPVVGDGKVFVGTNNERPRNPRDTKAGAPIDKGVLMCFDEATGKFLWQALHNKLPSGLVHDWPKEGICSTPAVEGKRIYYATNRCTVVCLDTDGLANGNQGITTEEFQTPTDADIIWELDMMTDLGVFPHNMTACGPLLVGDILYVVTANGVDEGHVNIPAPEAPSFIAIDKNSGKLLWKRDDPGHNIMHGQWANAAFATIGGQHQVIFPGGDGWIRGLDPTTGELLWKCDCNPKNSKYELGGTGTRSDFIGTPVVYKEKVYIGVGQDPEHFSGIGHFWCIDPTRADKKGADISPELGEWGKPGKPNPNSGIVWHYGGTDSRKFVPRDFTFGRTMSTAAIVDDILYIAELQGFIHCLDARTGKKFWQYDVKGAVWGSPYYVDGKVFQATEGGDLFVFKHEKQPQVIDELDIQGATNGRDFNKKRRAKAKEVEAAYLLHRQEFDAPIRSTVTVVNGTLYVMTESTLFAFGKK